ncbi:carboxymuconolactone decarboxylase family protein [Nitrosomonas communis]|uniref:carboxymuconolactone decarboxylase family protein n=1 Tax=Nitrosomonas communis TaxID=44574 RepID=UPI003D2772F1
MVQALQALTQSSSETTSAILFEIEQLFRGHVPNIFKVYAKYRPLLEANWNKFKRIMLDGKLRRKVKEAMALLISCDNECKYCVAAHTAALHSMKFDEAKIFNMLQDLWPADFTEKEIALIKFTRKANLHWHSIGKAERDELLDCGVNESEMLEVFGVMEIFIAFNRFADVMGIEIDF